MIAQNISRVRSSIEAACLRTNRDPASVTLIAVSKTHSAEEILEAAAAGLQHFGENRVEEAESKILAVNRVFDEPLTWHMIGHVQSRKAKDVLPLFNYIHSVDTVKLAAKFSALAVEAGQTGKVLLEVNVSGEEAKYGFQAAHWKDDNTVRRVLWGEIGQILALPGLEVCGLMTMAPIAEDPETVRPVFTRLYDLRKTLANEFQIALPELSMGMTDDYMIAVEEGATMVRVGRAIFGERQK
jgi:hypothetical protein